MTTWYQVKVKFSDIELESEIWKDISGYDGFYQVSNLGRVKSLDRTIVRSNGFKQSFREKILKTFIDRKGYEVLYLFNLGKRKRFKIHQLVAIIFHGHTPNGYKNVINHIDGDTLNNRATNLEIVSQRENTHKGKNVTESSSSKYVGVALITRKDRRESAMNPCWAASIHITGAHFRLGQRPFTSHGELECSELYQKALGKLLLDEKHYEDNIKSLSNKEKRKYLLS